MRGQHLLIGPDWIPLVVPDAPSNVSSLDAPCECCLSCILMLAVGGGGENDSSRPLCRLSLLAAAGDPLNDMEFGRVPVGRTFVLGRRFVCPAAISHCKLASMSAAWRGRKAKQLSGMLLRNATSTQTIAVAKSVVERNQRGLSFDAQHKRPLPIPPCLRPPPSVFPSLLPFFPSRLFSSEPGH